MASNIPYYVSDTEDDDEITNDEIALSHRRRTKRTRNWTLKGTYQDKLAAFDVIQKENSWSFHYKNKTKNGNNEYYRCNKAKRRGEQCLAGIYLHFDSQTDHVLLFRTEESQLIS